MNFLVIFLMDQAAFSIDEMGGGGGGGGDNFYIYLLFADWHCMVG